MTSTCDQLPGAERIGGGLGRSIQITGIVLDGALIGSHPLVCTCGSDDTKQNLDCLAGLPSVVKRHGQEGQKCGVIWELLEAAAERFHRLVEAT